MQEPVTRSRRVYRVLRWMTVAAFGGILIVLVVSFWVAGQLLAPAPSVAGTPPSDLPVETVSIARPSGDVVCGWFASGDEGRGTIVLLHPLRGSRRSMIKRAGIFHRAGYSVLLIDLQAHGESPGRHITAGYLESRDVTVAVEYVRSRQPGQPIGLIGVSLGGAAALLASPLDVDAMVLESVYPTIDEAVENRVRRWLGPLHQLPSWLLLVQLKPRLGISPAKLRPIDHVHDVGCPVLIMGGSVDQHTPPHETKRLFASAAEPKRLLIVEGAAHVDLQQFAPDTYADAVLPFIDEFMRVENDRSETRP